MYSTRISETGTGMDSTYLSHPKTLLLPGRRLLRAAESMRYVFCTPEKPAYEVVVRGRSDKENVCHEKRGRGDLTMNSRLNIENTP